MDVGGQRGRRRDVDRAMGDRLPPTQVVSRPAIDPTSLWDFDDPAGSEQRLRDAAAGAHGAVEAAWLTQVARAIGLQERYDEAHALLDELEAEDDETAVRLALERGRLLRSAGDDAAA